MASEVVNYRSNKLFLHSQKKLQINSVLTNTPINLVRHPCFKFNLNKSGDGGTNVPLPSHFQKSSKNYFSSIPSDEGPGTENPRRLGI